MCKIRNRQHKKNVWREKKWQKRNNINKIVRWLNWIIKLSIQRILRTKLSLIYLLLLYGLFMWTSELLVGCVVRFYGTSNFVGYFMPNPLYTYKIYMIWFGWVLWHIIHCRLFNAKSSLYIYIEYIWFGLVGFCSISSIVGYLMPNPLYTYILNMYDLVWLGFVAYQPL